MSSDNPIYFALEEESTKVNALLKKADAWNNAIISNNYLDKGRASWMAYYGAQRGEGQQAHKVTFGGEQGELAQISVNHYGNIAQHLINLTTANRPAMEAQAVNTDAKTEGQTILANGLLDYYMYQKKLEKYLYNATEAAVVLGEGFVRLGWNEKTGDAVFYDETTGRTMYKGDIEFSNLSPMDVVRDISREDDQNDWVLVRTYKNRFDLAAKYPHLKDEILTVKSKDYADFPGINLMFQEKTDQIAVWEFYHRRTEAVPNGNYMTFVSEDAVFYNGALPYREIPIYRITVKEVMGAPVGYTPMWDCLPLQEAINALYSTILTNQVAFGVQNILMPNGSSINPENLAGGLNVLYYDPDLGKPEPLNLTFTPQEIFRHIDMLRAEMETISGINSVIRGSPEASLRSGTALALVQAQAVSFASSLQQSYVRLVEDVGTGIIQMLQDYADEPRIAFISGKSNRTYLRDFKGSDLSNVNRVIVRTTSALSKTTAGRLEIATNLLQMGMVKTPEQYVTVLTTGKLESLYEGDQAQLNLIKKENEMLMEGQIPPIVETDWHMVHINEHQAVLADPQIRMNPEIRDAILVHMKAHHGYLTGANGNDLGFLMALGQQPIQQPPMGPPGAPGLNEMTPPSGPTPGNAVQAGQGMDAAAMMAPPAPGQEAQDVKLPVPPPMPPTAGEMGGEGL